MVVVSRDAVEVALAHDMTGNTALEVANLLFEMLCVFFGPRLAISVQFQTVSLNHLINNLIRRPNIGILNIILDEMAARGDMLFVTVSDIFLLISSDFSVLVRV